MHRKSMSGKSDSAHCTDDVRGAGDVVRERELSLSCLGAVWITSKVKSALNNIIVRLSIQENCFLWAEYK